MQAGGEARAALSGREARFLAEADSFYLATVGETGWPYVQHRGGPKGFLQVLSATQLAFPDFRGNRQFVSAGNVLANDRVAMIVVDYANRQRLKVLGRLRFIDVREADEPLVRRLSLPGYRASIERIALVDVEALDWNCPQHITPRYTIDEVEAAARPLRERIAELEEALRARA
jgi:predicted pyridoxine 5'-phosphate oxidase superfamily flavin-nucleotide-binding protein